MDRESKNISDSTLVKVIKGEASYDERISVAHWLTLKQENQDRFNKFETIWLEAGTINPKPIDIDTDSAWSSLSKRVDNYHSDSIKQGRVLKRWRLRSSIVAAASIAIIITATLLIPDISYIRRLFNGETILQSSITSLEQTLPDGSDIHLDKNSTLRYSDNRDKREVTLEGEAFFKVKRDTTKAFIVHAGAGGVKVLGTEFNIRECNSGDIMVDVLSGRVELFTPSGDIDTLRVILTSGHSGLISSRGGKIVEQDMEPDVFFKVDRRLIFRKSKLSTVFQTLEDQYGIDIESSNNSIDNLLLSSTFIDQDVDNILKVTAATFNLDIELIDNCYVVRLK